MANLPDQLRKLSKAHRKRVDIAKGIAHNMKIQAEAAKKAAETSASEKA